MGAIPQAHARDTEADPLHCDRTGATAGSQDEEGKAPHSHIVHEKEVPYA